ncbi:hypothetical protein WMY93_028730 [Mugilogobius chulae]|uniref:Protein kinase domain-containing protein n=1 Tax=Mugilogobius chulae TaxID=88201 RepID=A0AAW0MVD3_9GOBI
MEDLNPSLGQHRDFKKDDFEADWIKVSECRFGQVYQVKLKMWREKCAMKTFDAESWRQIINEVSTIAKVKFKYLVSVYGMCSEASGMVMEYMSNGSLNNLLASHTLTWPKKFQMIHETSMGLNFLHSMKPPLLHLNLKTSNLLLDDHLHVKNTETVTTLVGLKLTACGTTNEQPRRLYLDKSQQRSVHRGDMEKHPQEMRRKAKLTEFLVSGSPLGQLEGLHTAK